MGIAISLYMTTSTDAYTTTRMCINVARASVKDRGYAERAKLEETTQSAGDRNNVCIVIIENTSRAGLTAFSIYLLNTFNLLRLNLNHDSTIAIVPRSRSARNLNSRLTNSGLFYLSHVKLNSCVKYHTSTHYVSRKIKAICFGIHA